MTIADLHGMAPDSSITCSHEVANQHYKWKTDMEAVIRSQNTLAPGKTTRQQRQTKELWEALRELTTTHSGRKLIWRGLWPSYMR
jgi:hypothetical protein